MQGIYKMAKKKQSKKEEYDLIIQILIVLGLIWLASIILQAILPIAIIIGAIYLVWRILKK